MIERPEENHGARDTMQPCADLMNGKAHRQRIVALRDQVARRAYHVSAEDVAASIIRNAIVVAALAARLPR